MKKFLIGCTLVLVLLAGVCAASGTSANFSGTWALDKSKSDGLPTQWQNIESYTMVVTQDDKQLTVENKIAGGIGRRGERNGSGGQSGASGEGGQGAGQNGGQNSGMNGTRREGGFGGQGGGRGGRSGGMGMGTATYKLDGTETKIESAGGRGGGAALKAQWKESGKVLELTNTRSFNLQGSEMTRTTRDRWELGDGGKTLKVKRTIDGPQGTQESTLVFNRQ
jgi:hypothetical protein